jgi:APA family basic amino acid/polyamine antiporter
MMKSLFATKSLTKLLNEAPARGTGFKRTLTRLNLTNIGIGATIGAGIFVLTGQIAALYAGPAIVISFLISGLACALVALCYAEFAAMIPVDGSAYTYGISHSVLRKGNNA